MDRQHVVDLGEFGEAFRRDPHPVYARLREQGPVHRVRLPGAEEGYEAWLVVGYEEARAALADSRLAKDGSKIGATFLTLSDARTIRSQTATSLSGWASRRKSFANSSKSALLKPAITACQLHNS